MNRCVYKNIVVNHIEKGEKLDLFDDSEYYLAKADVFDADRMTELRNDGFVFHERFLDYIISPEKLNQNFVKMVRADVRQDSVISDEMVELACRSFIHDRRFHLEVHYNQEFANRIICSCIKGINEDKNMIYKCFHKEKLIGFTIIKMFDEKECENVLGAVDPDYQKKGAAFNLYVYMVDSLREKGVKALIGSIASDNVASLNLHLMLGATFSGVWDQYIRRASTVTHAAFLSSL